MRNLLGYCRAFIANYNALRLEYASIGNAPYSARMHALRDLLDIRNGNPFILSDLAVYYLLSQRSAERDQC